MWQVWGWRPKKRLRSGRGDQRRTTEDSAAAYQMARDRVADADTARSSRKRTLSRWPSAAPSESEFVVAVDDNGCNMCVGNHAELVRLRFNGFNF